MLNRAVIPAKAGIQNLAPQQSSMRQTLDARSEPGMTSILNHRLIFPVIPAKAGIQNWTK